MATKYHPNFGKVEVLKDLGDTTLVELESKERRVVTTAWLTDEPRKTESGEADGN